MFHRAPLFKLGSFVLTVTAFAACQASVAPPAGGGGGEPPGTPAPPASSVPPGEQPPAQPPANWGPTHCSSDPALTVGFDVGNVIGDLGLKDCETGEPKSIDEVCGAAATWVFVAHTHCPTCQGTARFTDDVAAAVLDKNVAIVHVVFDDNGTSCAEWRAAYALAGITNVRVYDDPTGGAYAKLKTSNFTAPSAFLDGRRVITYKEHGLSRQSVLTQIDKALGTTP